jgi:hypothetical protein
MAIPKNLRLKFKVPKSYVHPKPKINTKIHKMVSPVVPAARSAVYLRRRNKLTNKLPGVRRRVKLSISKKITLSGSQRFVHTSVTKKNKLKSTILKKNSPTLKLLNLSPKKEYIIPRKKSYPKLLNPYKHCQLHIAMMPLLNDNVMIWESNWENGKRIMTGHLYDKNTKKITSIVKKTGRNEHIPYNHKT